MDNTLWVSEFHYNIKLCYNFKIVPSGMAQ